MKKIIFNLIQFIIGAILVFSIVVVVFPLLPPFRGFYHTRAVLTGSMEPAVKKGSLIVNKWIEDRDIRKGDIVTFRKPTERNVFITHRIEKVKKTEPLYRFRTKGDANGATDFWEITQANIEGKVIFTIPFLGYLIEFFKTPVGFILVVVLPLLVFIIKEILQTRKICQEIRTKGRKKPEEKIKTKKKILSVIIIISLLLLSRIQGTFALFSSNTVSIASVTLQTAAEFSSSDDSRPSSEITDITGSGSLGVMTNLDEFTVHYDAEDSGSGVDYVELWYSFNYGDWQYFGKDVPCSPGSFVFTSPNGDGSYEFLTVAVDKAGNVEDKDGDEIDDNVGQEALNGAYGAIDELAIIQVDTGAPYTNLSLGEFGDETGNGNRFAVNEQMVNGNFEDTNCSERGWVLGGDGEHKVVDNADLISFGAEVKAGQNSALVGWTDDFLLSDDQQDYIYQIVPVPDTPSTLSFWYRVLSDDIVDYDWFEAKVIDNNDLSVSKTITKVGSDTLGGWDTGWEEITYGLDSWFGKTIQVWFGVTNNDLLGDPQKTYALIDDVRITNSDNFITSDKKISLDSSDAFGSGTVATYYQINDELEEEYIEPIDLSGKSGSTKITYYSEDDAGNTEDSKTIEVEIDDTKNYFGVVLNEFMPNPIGDDDASMTGGEWVELYNNSNLDINVGTWVLYDSDDSHPLTITNLNTDTGDTIVPSEGLLRVYLNGVYASGWLNNGGDQIRLYDGLIGSGGILIDSFTYPSCQEDKSWKRIPDGTGTWADPEEEKEIETEIKSVGGNKILLSIFNIPDDYGNGDLLEYEIVYNDGSENKGISGEILPNAVKDGKADREFYLGVCSTGVCVPDVVKDRKIHLIVTQKTTKIIDSDFDI